MIGPAGRSWERPCFLPQHNPQAYCPLEWGVMSAVEAGSGIAVAVDFGYTFGDRVKFLHLTPEPRPFSVGIVAPNGRLSPAAEKFWQCAKEAAAK